MSDAVISVGRTQVKGTLSTAVARWSGLGPYFAMFPVDFAFEVVQRFSEVGGRILDPFAGRASSIYAAAATGRSGTGIEINSVGWLYGQVKLSPGPKDRVLRRLEDLRPVAASLSPHVLAALPEFFRVCYAPEVIRFLVAGRQALRWQVDRVDATLMAIILVYLHGKRRYSLSNQTRQSKAMAPDYSIRWWREHQTEGYDRPPEIDPYAFLRPRVEWRFAKGEPVLEQARVIRGDCTRQLPFIKAQISLGREQPYDLLFTSPPYYSITNYHYDQWLRGWMLGGTDRPTKSGGPWQAKFESLPAYMRLLETAFRRCASLMRPSATVYVRTDARPATHIATLAALNAAFRHKHRRMIPRPLDGKSQTRLFGDRTAKPGEVDLILQPNT